MDSRFEGMPRAQTDLTWPKDYDMPQPPFLSDPMYGGGVFDNPNGGDKVTYWTVERQTDLMSFYTTMAANMLSGSSAAERDPRIETVRYGIESEKSSYCYNIDVPDSGVSALVCFFFSEDGISDIYLMGPDPGDHIDYKFTFDKEQGKPSLDGWINETMRVGWYPHRSEGEWRCNVAALTIIDPAPGSWNIYLCGENGNNRSLHAYTTLVNGANVDIQFRQGDDPSNPDYPVTSGNFTIRISDHNGVPMSEAFYDSLNTQCSATRIPPWVPISGEEDISGLMGNPTEWVNQAAVNYQRPEKWLTQMSGANIRLQKDKDDEGNPVLTGRFDAPLPGLYYMTLNMTFGDGSDRIDYSKAFWAPYEPRTDRQIKIDGLDQDFRFDPPYLPEAWGKTSNTPKAENLILNIDADSVEIIPANFASVRVDPDNSQSLIIHSNQKGRGTLSFDVATEYGDKWTLEYDVIIE